MTCNCGTPMIYDGMGGVTNNLKEYYKKKIFKKEGGNEMTTTEGEYTLMDVARMLTGIPLHDDIKILSAKLEIRYTGYTGTPCRYTAELPIPTEEMK